MCRVCGVHGEYRVCCLGIGGVRVIVCVHDGVCDVLVMSGVYSVLGTHHANKVCGINLCV